jgi:rhodanese-related sulfurtransferase
MRQLTPGELAAWLSEKDRQKPLLLDVREAWEFAHCHIVNSIHVPMNAVPASLSDWDDDAPIVAICHHGARSFQVAYFLEQNGFQQVYNLSGGVDAWAKTVDPAMPTY